MNTGKVNNMGMWGTSITHEESNFEEESKYLDREMEGFCEKGQCSNKYAWNSRKGNQGQNYYGNRYRDRSKEIYVD